ncbi:hypothetical protein FA15DRAFT_709708 [Coprinopsis marcescibilis]|uniref:DUF6534 domain-containing protein n=1 Tax=Coprinopsis marcescibilis TaxID=230819 RepID=A0A5C3KES3_COPMA|nr:hypothetical protein FA15DRAFT_709708 [Coprinopsis marcescibilis]
MISLLSRYKAWTAFGATKSMLAGLIMMTLETGLLITVFALLNLVFFLVRPLDSIHNAFHWVLHRIYANAILATLNNRQRVRANMALGTAATTPEFQAIRFALGTINDQYSDASNASSQSVGLNVISEPPQKPNTAQKPVK